MEKPLLPTQAFNLAFKDSFKHMFTKHNAKIEFGKYVANLISGSLTAASSMTILYPLDYAHTRLASDVDSGKNFIDLGDCISKIMKGTARRHERTMGPLSHSVPCRSQEVQKS